MEHKVSNLEARVSNLETRMAVAERDIEGINKKLDKIDANVTRLVWIVMAAVVAEVLRVSLGG